MTSYTVTQISLGEVPGIHNGTGTWHDLRWVVVPGSVSPPGKLAFTGQELDVTTMLFAIADNVVPNWFGVAIPEGISEFSNANIFFHPTPGQAGYLPGDYPAKTGKWPDLFYYMERLGYQLDGAARNQVVIMPFLTEGAKDTGILPGHWEQIITDILTAVRDTVTGTAGPPVAVSSVVVSSFSAGIIYSDSFRKLATGLKPLLDEVWDLDGNYSTYHAISQSLRTTAGCRVIQYDQIASNDLVSFHVPLPRWADYAAPPTTTGQVHSLISEFMFLHAATISDVGDIIVLPHTGTGTGTFIPVGFAPDSGAGPPTPAGPVPDVPVPSVPVPAIPAPAIPVPGVPVPAAPLVPLTNLPTPMSGSAPVLKPQPQVLPVSKPVSPLGPVKPPESYADAALASGCCAVVAISGLTAAVGQTAITAVTAIAAQRSARTREGHRPVSPGATPC
jgi:hypothetical protein